VKRTGSSLIEVTFALGILAMLLITFFVIMDVSIRSFQNALVRHNIQSDTQRISYRLSEDLRRSHFFTVSNVELRSSGNKFDRHTLCIAAVRDWSQPGAIDPITSRPRWDGYVLYYCQRQSGDEPLTRLFRCWLKPANPSEVGQFAFPSLNPSIHCKPDPNSVAEIESFSMLSDLVEVFSSAPTSHSQWEVKFRLRQLRGRQLGTKRVDDVLETTIQMRPENTFPVYY
jgi:hypothetical protein